MLPITSMAPRPVSRVYPQAPSAVVTSAATTMIAARRQSMRWRNANARLVLVNNAEIAMIGTTGSAPTIGTSTSGISAPVP